MMVHPPSPSCSGDWGKELWTSLGIAAKAYLSKKYHLIFWVTIESKLIFNFHTIFSFLNRFYNVLCDKTMLFQEVNSAFTNGEIAFR